jgi:hypothetical protein
MRLSRRGCKRSAVGSSQTREVSLPILDSIMFPSASIVPLYSEPYATGSIYLPYVSDSSNIARECEPSTHSWKDARPGSGVRRRHTRGPANRSWVKFAFRRVASLHDMPFLFRMSSRVLTAARRTDVISRHMATVPKLSEIQEVAIISCVLRAPF